MNQHALTEHDYEPVHGLPAHLPRGERILWQGAPCWRTLAIRAFHVRKVAIYFALFGLWRAGSTLAEGQGLVAGLASTQGLIIAALLAIGLLGGMAWLYARTTVYTLTDRRLVLRSGVALSMTMNIPFRLIESAALKLHADGTGDIPLQLVPGERASYIMLWPNAKPWHLSRPQPMLRGIPVAEQVAGQLSRALTEALPSTAQPAARQPERGAPNIMPEPRRTAAV